MKLVEIALGQKGVTEDPAHTNRGEAKKYQDAVGLPHDEGFPWCQSFVYWCGMTAYGAANPVPKTGGVLECWRVAVAHPVLNTVTKADVSLADVQPGWQVIWDHGAGNGHTGIVTEVTATGFYVIAGNTNDDGSRDGYGVFVRFYTLSDAKLVGFICYEDVAEAA